MNNTIGIWDRIVFIDAGAGNDHRFNMNRLDGERGGGVYIFPPHSLLWLFSFFPLCGYFLSFKLAYLLLIHSNKQNPTCLNSFLFSPSANMSTTRRVTRSMSASFEEQAPPIHRVVPTRGKSRGGRKSTRGRNPGAAAGQLAQIREGESSAAAGQRQVLVREEGKVGDRAFVEEDGGGK